MKKTASTPKRAPAKDVDAYLASAPKELQAVLENLRESIKAAAPQAEELISYQIPTYKYHGPLVHFVARELLQFHRGEQNGFGKIQKRACRL